MQTAENAKVWRYFDQRKAKHLIETSKLYLRRLDLLTDAYEGDPYEGTPTFAIFQGWKEARLQAGLPAASDAELMRHFERERKSTFVSCWQKSEYESWLMWKQYCRKGDGFEGGGFALQTTMKRIWLLHQALHPKHKILHLQPVRYLDHWTDCNLPHSVPIQVFVKPVWFLGEMEIRLALFRADCAWGGTEEQIEAAITQLKEGELIEIPLSDLVERIVLNPFASDDQKNEILNLVETHRRDLQGKLRESGIAKKSVLSRFLERHDSHGEN